MIYNMRGDTYHAGPVVLSDVYTSAVGSAKDGVAASQRALYDAYNSLNSSIIDNIYPVGSLYMSINPTLPEALSTGRTWQLLSGGYVLKTIETGTGGETTAAAATGGPSNNTSGAASGNTGGHTLTTSEIPSHNHKLSSRHFFTTNAGIEAHGQSLPSGGISLYYSNGLSTDNSGGGGSHTHSLGNHTHTLSSHTHTTGMPANIGIYIWKRTK